MTFYSDASVLHPKVLAEGGRLAFFLSKSTTVIHVADASRLEDARSLVRGHAPQLSPDGEMIYYVGQGPDQEGIFVVSRTGGVPCRLTPSLPASSFTRPFHLSPDGRTLAYFSHRGDGTTLFALSVGGGEPRQLLELDAKEALSPAWSPDGSLLAHASGNGLYVLPAAGGQPRQLAHLYSWDEWTVRWSPDGNHLAALGYASPEEQVNSVFLVPSSGGEPRRLTALDEGGYKEGLEWHPDSRRVTYFDYGSDTTRHVYLDGRPPTTLFDQPERWEYVGRWSPDGRRYFFESSLTGPGRRSSSMRRQATSRAFFLGPGIRPVTLSTGVVMDRQSSGPSPTRQVSSGSWITSVDVHRPHDDDCNLDGSHRGNGCVSWFSAGSALEAVPLSDPAGLERPDAGPARQPTHRRES